MWRSPVLVPMLASMVLVACDRPAPAPPPPRPAIVQSVAEVAATHSARYSGKVHARFETVLSFREAGKVIDRKVNLGDRVEAGQVLAKLDPGDLRLAAQAADAELAAARERHAQAERQYQRAASLLQRGLISQSRRDERKVALDVAASQLKQARKRHAAAHNRLDYARLRADHAGIITAVHVEPGQVVAAGQAVFGFARGQARELWVAVPESRIDTIHAGDAATVELWALPEVRVPGQVREVAADADPRSGTYRVRISLLQPPEGLRLGMSGSALFRGGAGGKVVRLPLTSLYHAGTRPAVWVVDQGTGAVALQPVTVLRYDDDAVVLAAGQGLQQGAWVVTKGVSQLYPGQQVEPARDFLGTEAAGREPR